MGTPVLVALMVGSMLTIVAVWALISERRHRTRTNRA